MARILTQPLSQGLVVENPHASLRGHLEAIGMQTTWLQSVPDEDALIDALRDTRAQVLFKRSRVPVSARLIQSCPELHAIQLCCIGDDSVDKPACASEGVLVFNDPVSNGRSVVELAIGHIIALSRRLYETDRECHENQWSKTASGRYEIYGKVLGIVGLGNIGRQVARAAQALGMSIRFYDSRPVAQEVGVEMGWGMASTLEELFRQSDVVTVHTSATDYLGHDNASFLDSALSQLGADRPESSPRLFLNLARGNVLSPDALNEAVRQGPIRRAAIDVYPREPRPGDASWQNPYADQPRIVCTPHIGAATQEAQPRIARRVATTIGSWSRYGTLRDCVYAPRAALSVKDSARGRAVLAVVHSVARGTKKAVDDAIYEAEASNLGSAHRDFTIGVAYDVSVLDRPLSRAGLDQLIERAAGLAGDGAAIRAVRQIEVPAQGW